MSGKDKQPLLPKLRFAEFRGEWITVELGRFSQLVTERVGVTACVPYTIAAGIGLISQEEKLGRIIAGSSLKNYIVLQRNDFAYNKSATKAYPEGFIALYAGDERAAVPNSIFTCFRVNQSQVNPSFLSELFQNNLHGKWLKTRVAVGARAHGSLQVSNDDLMAIPVPLPSDSSSLVEQQKIAACLSSLNTLITAQTQKLDTLKTHKKGLMQQLFPRAGETTPRLRFAEFRDAGEWEAQTLKEISEPVEERVGDRSLTPISISAGIGFVPQAEKFGRDISGNQYKLYTVIRDGDFVYNKGNSLKFPQGCVYDLQGWGEAAAPNVFICFRLKTGYENAFYRQCFERNLHGIQLRKQITSGARSNGLLNISKEVFYGISIPTPQLEEQQKIAACLSSLDELITAQAQKVAALQTHKKGLMQQLFPVQSEASA